MRELPIGSMMRGAVAGDLPGIGDDIDHGALRQLARVAQSRQLDVMFFTHKWQTRTAAVRVEGVTINASCDTYAQVDVARSRGMPAVLAVPQDWNPVSHTPGSTPLVECPAGKPTPTGPLQCTQCKYCWKGDRKAAVVFRAHGSGAKKVIWAKQV